MDFISDEFKYLYQNIFEFNYNLEIGNITYQISFKNNLHFENRDNRNKY